MFRPRVPFCATVSAVTQPSSEFRFQVGSYRAELRNSQSGKHQWYVMVFRSGSGDLAALDRFDSYDEAREAALATLARLDRAAGQ